MNDPVAVDPARLFEFVAGPEAAVLFVSAHRAHGFNRALGDYFGEDQKTLVLFGTVELVELVLSAPQVLAFLHEGLRACGGPSALGVAPGYWLFARGEVLAWDAGLPSGQDVAAVARSTLLAAVWSGITRDLSHFLRALRAAAADAAALRMASAFRVALADGRSRRQWPPVRDDGGDELLRAHQTLGVSPGASEEQVNEAWRRRRMECHPDHAAGDPREFERRSRLSAEINQARDFILQQRAHARRRATA